MHDGRYLTCPYCGVENFKVIRGLQFGEMGFVTSCDADRDNAKGCGRRFAVYARLDVVSKVRKIEGEE